MERKIMHKPFTLLEMVFGAILLSFITVTAAWADIRIGVLAPRGELVTITTWSAFGKYLSQAIGQPVAIRPLGPPKVVPAAKDGAVDFVLSHAGHTITIQEQLGGTALLTLNSKAGSEFAGVIVAKKGSGITHAKDLKGKKVMSLSRSAAGAYAFQVYYLMQQGIDPDKDFSSFKEGKKQDDLVLAVNAGLIDAAFVRTGILEKMSKEGKIRIGDFVVVDQQNNDDLSLVHTTRLYPEWYLTALSGTAPEVVKAVKAAALKLTPNTPAAKTAGIKGFVEPLSLDGMKEALKALKLAPYDQ
jgi:ABC-type phosphate/phosphonate transport system substrate-binding protein